MFKILVAEDDASTNRLFCAILRRAGYEPVPATDGEDALQKMDEYKIDLLVCDVMMPRLDGFGLTQAIRESGSMLPILMVTAKALPEDKHRGFLVGTDDYITKPVDKEEMLLRIRALLRRARIVDERKITIGDVVLDYDTHTVRRGHEVQTLPPRSSACSTSCWPTPTGRLPGCNCSMKSGAWIRKATSAPSTSTSTGCAPGSTTGRSLRSRPCGAWGTALSERRGTMLNKLKHWLFTFNLTVLLVFNLFFIIVAVLAAVAAAVLIGSQLGLVDWTRLLTLPPSAS